MSRAPSLWFILIGLVPPLLLPNGVLGSTVMLTALFPALAAMLLISGDERRPVPGHGTKRLLVAAGVVVVLVGARLAWTGLDGILYKLLAIGIPAALAAWVLSGVYAPSPAVRHWVRSLVARGAPRRVYLVSVLAWPLLTAAAVAVCAAVPGLSVAPPRLASADLLAVITVTGVFGAALSALAWYGFVARRLLPRLSPLAAGLLIGVVQWLVLWGLAMRPATVLRPFFLIQLATLAAGALVAMWVSGRSRGSLLPVWLLGITLSVSQAVGFLTVTPDAVERTQTLGGVFAAGQLAVALVLVITGRMWRSPAAPTERLAASELESS